MVRTTVTATVIRGGNKSNRVPTEASALVNIRTLPGETLESVTRRVRGIVRDRHIEIRSIGRPRDASPVSTVEGAPYQLLKETIREITPDEEVVIAPYLVPGGTDARHYATLTDAVYRFIGMRLTRSLVNGFHGADERLPVVEYLRATALYSRLIQRIDRRDAAIQPPEFLAACDSLIHDSCTGR